MSSADYIMHAMRERDASILKARRELTQKNLRKTHAYWRRRFWMVGGCTLAVGALLSYGGITWLEQHQAENARVALNATLQTSEPQWTESAISAAIPVVPVIEKPKPKVATPALKMPAPKVTAKAATIPPLAPRSLPLTTAAKADTSKVAPATPSRIWESNVAAVADPKPTVKAAEVAKPNVDFKLVDLPTSTTAMIQIGNVVRPIKVGEKLPNGEVIQSIDVDAKNITLAGGKKVKLP